MAEDPSSVPRYVISVAARLAGLPAHTLRLYDRWGLVQPARTGGRNRLYSDADIARIAHIASLAARGVNLAGIKVILEMEAQQSDRSSE